VCAACWMLVSLSTKWTASGQCKFGIAGAMPDGEVEPRYCRVRFRTTLKLHRTQTTAIAQPSSARAMMHGYGPTSGPPPALGIDPEGQFGIPYHRDPSDV